MQDAVMPASAESRAGSARPADHRRGAGVAMVVYLLFLGSVLAVVTAPLGVALAHLYRRRAAAWAASHLRFQARTFWLGALAGILFVVAWQLLGWLGASPVVSWALGYAFFTACLVWMVGRCAVGIHRLTSGRPVGNPRSLAFGGPDSGPSG